MPAQRIVTISIDRVCATHEARIQEHIARSLGVAADSIDVRQILSRLDSWALGWAQSAEYDLVLRELPDSSGVVLFVKGAADATPEFAEYVRGRLSL